MNNHNVELTIQPMSKGWSHTILKSVEEKKTAWVKPGKFLCVKTMSRRLEVREGEQLPGGREIAVPGCFATRGEEEVSA